MPVLETRTIIFEGENFRRTIRVNKDGVFHITLPKPVAPALGLEDDEVSAETKDKAIAKFEKCLEDYKYCKTTSQKVILYGFQANCTIMDKAGEICTVRLNDLAFSDGSGLTFWVEVSEEIVVTQEDGRKNYQYKRAKSCIPPGFECRDNFHGPKRYSQPRRHENLLEWTPEREAAIAELCRRLVELIDQFRKMVTNKQRFFEKLDAFGMLPAPKTQRGKAK